MAGMVLAQDFLVGLGGQLALGAIGEEDKIDREDQENSQENRLFATATARALQAATEEEHGVGFAEGW